MSYTPWKFQVEQLRPMEIPHDFFLITAWKFQFQFHWAEEFPHALSSINLEIPYHQPPLPHRFRFFWNSAWNLALGLVGSNSEKWPKTAWKLKKKQFRPKTVENMTWRDKPIIFWVVGCRYLPCLEKPPCPMNFFWTPQGTCMPPCMGHPPHMGHPLHTRHPIPHPHTPHTTKI